MARTDSCPAHASDDFQLTTCRGAVSILPLDRPAFVHRSYSGSQPPRGHLPCNTPPSENSYERAPSFARFLSVWSNMNERARTMLTRDGTIVWEFNNQSLSRTFTGRYFGRATERVRIIMKNRKTPHFATLTVVADEPRRAARHGKIDRVCEDVYVVRGKIPSAPGRLSCGTGVASSGAKQQRVRSVRRSWRSA